MSRGRLFIIAFLLVFSCLFSTSLSIYDLQFTTNPGQDNTYPSVHRGSTVTTQGIVVTNTFRNNSFFISSYTGGPWNGVQVMFQHPSIKKGDLIEITAEVHENYGNTVLRNIRGFRIISRNNPLPPPVKISIAELSDGEKYEGVIVKIQNVRVISDSTFNGKWIVSDNSGRCIIDEGFFNFEENFIFTDKDDIWDYIIGVVEYRHGEFSINPISGSHMKKKTLGTTDSSWGRIKSLYR